MNDFDATAYAAGAEMSFDEMYPVLASLRRFKPRVIADFERALDDARRFRREWVDDNALRIDRLMMADPTYVAEDAIAEAAQRGWFSAMVPRIFGGQGMSFGALVVGYEELGAGCLGISNLIGVHGLALSTIAATGELEKMEMVARRFTETAKTGRPHLLSTAITEPSAGTDVEDEELLRKARLMCEAKPVQGGYKLNGRKVFISNGSIAGTHVVIMPTDKKHPVETTFAFLVESSTPGFSVGRVEKKMGQKACPAAELVFDDCFVPESARINAEPLPGRRVDLVLGATRGAVGAWGTAVARGAFERAVRYARTHKLGGRWLLDEQWVQMKLSDMYRNVMIGRALWLEAMLDNELFGLGSLMGGGAAQELTNRLPDAVLQSRPMLAMLRSKRMRDGARSAATELDQWKVDTSCAFGAASKVTGTDLGMHNCGLAMDIMGADGLRHDRGMEKLYRDAKLLQIYEGTNQLNRLELFKRAVKRQGLGTQAEAAASAPERTAAQDAEQTRRNPS